jgi:AMIN domain-containing protein
MVWGDLVRRLALSTGLLFLLLPLHAAALQGGQAPEKDYLVANPASSSSQPIGETKQTTSATSVAAAVISSVAIMHAAQRVAVRVEGEGLPEIQAARLQNPERLILDFAGARLGVQKTVIPGEFAPVRRVRLGQYRPDVARVVVDLTTVTPYQLAREASAIIIYFDAQSYIAPTASAVAGRSVTDVQISTPHFASPEELTQPSISRQSDPRPRTPAALDGVACDADPNYDEKISSSASPTEDVYNKVPDPPITVTNVTRPDQSPPPPSGARAVPPRATGTEIEPGQMYFELRYTVDGTDVQGNADRSFLHQGINHTAELIFFNSEPLAGNRRFETLAEGRYTNNPQVDPERNSLQRAYLRLKGQSFEANLGDALVNYSRLSFNQNIKGLHVWKNLLPRLRATGTVGFFVDRWGSLYRNYTFFRDLAGPPNPFSPGKPYSRFVAGARLEQKFGRADWIALNWSHGKDLQQSLPDATLACLDPTTGLISIQPLSTGCTSPPGTEIPGFRRPFPQAINNDVVSSDTNLQLPLRISFRGEFAYSWTSGGTPPQGANSTNFVCASQPPVFGASVLDERCFAGQVGDWAGRLEARERIWKLNWNVDYSRFEPNFFSANARQIQDLQDFMIRGEYELTRKVSVIGSWRRSNDNLNGLRNFTNVVRAPEGRLVLRELPFYRAMTLEMGYRERNLDTPGTPGPLDLQKRSTRIPFLSLNLPIRTTKISFDYEHRHEMNAVTPQLSTDTDHFAVGYRARYSWDRWEFSPSARFEIERLNKDVPLNAALSPTDMTLLFPGDFFFPFDTNRTIQAGFLLEAPRYFRIEGNYKEFNSLALSPLQASKQLNPQMPFLYFNQGFKRPSWNAAVTYKIGNDENRTVTAFYLRTNNRFPTGDPFVPDLRSFRETVIGGTIVFRLRM